MWSRALQAKGRYDAGAEPAEQQTDDRRTANVDTINDVDGDTTNTSALNETGQAARACKHFPNNAGPAMFARDAGSVPKQSLQARDAAGAEG